MRRKPEGDGGGGGEGPYVKIPSEKGKGDSTGIFKLTMCNLKKKPDCGKTAREKTIPISGAIQQRTLSSWDPSECPKR